uniref:Uncharacterized protein n=1 Tax=Rousettus aegyptiacus TaxID=9407 RepID=A0A7J8HSI1_ROUAE|nr:hypothetical protein HJG63_011006 [Rousettus aegyptiacus]
MLMRTIGRTESRPLLSLLFLLPFLSFHFLFSLFSHKLFLSLYSLPLLWKVSFPKIPVTLCLFPAYSFNNICVSNKVFSFSAPPLISLPLHYRKYSKKLYVIPLFAEKIISHDSQGFPLSECPTHYWLLCLALSDVGCAQIILSAQTFATEVGPEASNLSHIMIVFFSSLHLTYICASDIHTHTHTHTHTYIFTSTEF